MKKTVLAFAVAAAMGVPAVAAADVTLYGRIHASVDAMDNGVEKSTSVYSNRSSRLGVRGSEDLGGGLTGIFQVESSIDPAGQTGTWVGRDAFVGLGGEFGQLRLGTMVTPYESMVGSLNVFGDSVLDVRTLTGARNGTFAGRMRNSLAYSSPNFSGFQVMAQYSTDTVNDNASDADANDRNAYSLAASYRDGPLRVFGAYEQRNKVGRNTAPPSSGTAVAGVDNTRWIVGGSYRIDDLTLNAAYDRVEDGSVSRNAWTLSARYNLGQAYLMGVYADAGSTASGADNGAKFYGVGAGYNFSRRTSVYVAYAKVDNDDNASYGRSATNTAAASNGVDPANFSLGIQHDF